MNISKCVAAFLNTNGGRIFVGVTDTADHRSVGNNNLGKFI